MNLNVELEREALLTLNRVIDPLDYEVIEEHVEDAASYHDEQTGFADYWEGDVMPVVRRLCEYFNIELPNGMGVLS